MMWYSEGQPGWGGWTLMLVAMLILWGLLIWTIWSVLRPGLGGDKISPDRSPEQLLAHRFAAGEIDADTYRRGIDVLAGNDRLTDEGSHR